MGSSDCECLISFLTESIFLVQNKVLHENGLEPPEVFNETLNQVPFPFIGAEGLTLCIHSYSTSTKSCFQVGLSHF
jgi:hypothetical protein